MTNTDIHVANGYFHEKQSALAAFQSDLEEAVFQARKIMREGRQAVMHYRGTGLIRPKTAAEIKADLQAASHEVKKPNTGRPNSDAYEIMQAETADAFDRYRAGENIRELAAELGITPNALHQRFQTVRRQRGLAK
jgi:hypothetical protein